MSGAYDHRCADSECPTFGQRTSKSCQCHQTREQMMLAAIGELAETLKYAVVCQPQNGNHHFWVDDARAVLAKFDADLRKNSQAAIADIRAARAALAKIDAAQTTDSGRAA